jgi:DNA modification methylase
MQNRWPADRVERRKVADLIPYARNARTHSDEQVAQIAASIREWGWTTPVLIDEAGGIIAGHGRVMAARKLGLTDVPVMVAAGWSEAQKRAYVLADNKLALNAGWNDELLALELGEIGALGFDLGLTGFGTDEISALSATGTAGLTDPDAVPEPPVDPVTKPGDLWLLGEHRVMCGDSTKAEDVERLMAGAKADLCFTSPPYGQQRDYTEEGKAKVADWDGLMRGVSENLPMADAGQVLVNLGMIHRDGEWLPYWDGWIALMREQGWRRFGWYVWDQGPGMPGDWNGRLAPSHEFIWHFNRESVRAEKARECKHAGEKHGGKGQRGVDGVVKQRSAGNSPVQSHAIHDSVFRVSRQCAQHGADGHPAPYPVGLPAIAMQSWPGNVYEPFCGSGTTLIAAEQLGRKCYGMEISPAYCDVIVKRWQDFTGKKARHADTNMTFEEHRDGQAVLRTD